MKLTRVHLSLSKLIFLMALQLPRGLTLGHEETLGTAPSCLVVPVSHFKKYVALNRAIVQFLGVLDSSRFQGLLWGTLRVRPRGEELGSACTLAILLRCVSSMVSSYHVHTEPCLQMFPEHVTTRYCHSVFLFQMGLVGVRAVRAKLLCRVKLIVSMRGKPQVSENLASITSCSESP